MYVTVTRKRQNRIGYEINRKKVRRLMAENNLLDHSYNKRKPVTRVVQSIVDVALPDKVWEFDIKYVWIHGEARNAYLLAMIDCYSRGFQPLLRMPLHRKQCERDHDGST